MENQKNVIFNDNKFETYKIDKVGVIKIKNDVYNIVTDLPESSNFFIALDKLENDKNISAILFINNNEALGSKAYLDYINTTKEIKITNEIDLKNLNINRRNKQITIINRLILKIVHSSKTIFFGMTGEIVTPFLGLSLAADFRFVSDKCLFILSHSSLDIHPSGGLLYFLPKYLGLSKTSKILYSTEKITPEEALEMELIYKLFNETNFEEKCIVEINEILKLKKNDLKCIKRLWAYNFNDIEKYLSIEECDFIKN